jgi:NTP pyrophosphatase (non-canonical NTP hydrolase)
MQLNDYHDSARRTANTLDPKELLNNAALGLAGESGECCDIVKKWLHQGHPLDRDKLILELGDVLWYIVQAAAGLNISLEDIARANIEKLMKRYPQGFRAECSLNREGERIPYVPPEGYASTSKE